MNPEKFKQSLDGKFGKWSQALENEEGEDNLQSSNRYEIKTIVFISFKMCVCLNISFFITFYLKE